jgi:hypothetical protein
LRDKHILSIFIIHSFINYSISDRFLGIAIEKCRDQNSSLIRLYSVFVCRINFLFQKCPVKFVSQHRYFPWLTQWLTGFMWWLTSLDADMPFLPLTRWHDPRQNYLNYSTYTPLSVMAYNLPHACKDWFKLNELN